MVKIFSKYKPPKHGGIIFNLPSMTQQNFKEECDINNILAKFVKTGILEQSARPGDFFDATTVSDYRDALHALSSAQESFSELPSAIRKYFENDPANFLEFIENPDNIDEGIKIGLYNPKNRELQQDNTQSTNISSQTGPNQLSSNQTPPQP